MEHGRLHWRCCGRPLLRKLLWLLSLVALVFAWIASFRQAGTFLKLPVAHLYWDALVLGVLAVGLKHGRRCHHAEVCKECEPAGEEKSM